MAAAQAEAARRRAETQEVAAAKAKAEEEERRRREAEEAEAARLKAETEAKAAEEARAAAVETWLGERGLGEYAEAFVREGFNDLEDLEAMSSDDLATLCKDVAQQASEPDAAAEPEPEPDGEPEPEPDAAGAESDSVVASAKSSGFAMLQGAKRKAKEAAEAAGAAASRISLTESEGLSGGLYDVGRLSPGGDSSEDDDDDDHDDDEEEEEEEEEGEGQAGLSALGGGLRRGLSGAREASKAAMDASKSGLTGAMDASKSAMQQAGSAGGAAMKAAELAKEKARAIDVSSLIDVQYEIDGEEVAVQFGVVREDYTPSFDTAIGADQGDKVQILEGGEEAECAPTF